MTAFELPSLAQVQKVARGALRAADAADTVPVPIDEVIAAARLHPVEALSDLGEDHPLNMRVLLKVLKKVQGVFDQRERQIYIDPTMGRPRQRFVKGHEAGHALLGWHKGAYEHGDDDTTLAPDTLHQLEQEANAFSAELLFGGGTFISRADDYAAGLGPALELCEQYETSAQASLRHYAGHSKHVVALLVLGRYPVIASGGTPGLKVMTGQCAQSPAFLARYGSVAGLVPAHVRADLDDAVTLAARTGCGVGATDAVLTLHDPRRGGLVQFTAEVFSNGRLKFVLLYRRPFLPGPRLRAVPA